MHESYEVKIVKRFCLYCVFTHVQLSARENEHYIVHLQAQFAESGLAADA